MGFGILNFASGAGADVAVNIDDEDLVRHIDLALMHIVKHFLRSFRPYFIVSRVAEKANGDNDITIQGQAFLSLKKLFLEAGASAQGYDFVFADHMLLGGSPLATDRRDDCPFLLEFGKSLVNFLAINARYGGYFSC